MRSLLLLPFLSLAPQPLAWAVEAATESQSAAGKEVKH